MKAFIPWLMNKMAQKDEPPRRRTYYGTERLGLHELVVDQLQATDEIINEMQRDIDGHEKYAAKIKVRLAAQIALRDELAAWLEANPK